MKIKLENDNIVEAQAPYIISASRSTDIPAFYTDWFFHRLKVGYCAWINPFNNKKLYVSFANCRFIVFWSKNPKPLLKYLNVLNDKNIGYYIQFTLNDYEKEGLENGLPPLKERIDTFKELSQIIGKNNVSWRFDPLILTDSITINTLLDRINYIGNELHTFTEKLVFSFVDINNYRKVRQNMASLHAREWENDEMHIFASSLEKLNQKWNFTLASCGEKIDLGKYGIQHNHCIDKNLIIQNKYKDKILMDFLNIDKLKDKGQRESCGCISSKDIGQYNTCPHQCIYCYANKNIDSAIKNRKWHMDNPFGETIAVAP